MRALLPPLAMCSLVLSAGAAGLSGLTQSALLPVAADPELASLADSWGALAERFFVPGAAVAMIKDGKTYVWTYGERNPETHQPVTPDTMFSIASITKTYTATAVVKLAEEGKLNLSDPITNYLPGLKLGSGPAGEAVDASTVTVEDLITHRKGINASMVVALDAYSGEITPERYDYWLAKGEVKGTTEYTNVNLTLAGRVIEVVTGMGWRDYLEQAILKPAGLSRTTGYASVMYTDADAALPTVWDGRDWVVAAQQKTDRTMHAAGGLGSTARDAAAWLTLHLNDGEIEVNGQPRRILRAASARSMHELHAERDEPEGSIRVSDGFGYGWNVGTFVGQTPLSSHGGGYVGTSTWYGFLPEEQAGIVVLTNGDGSTGAWVDVVGVEFLTHITGLVPDRSLRENFSRQLEQMTAVGQAPRVSQPDSPVTDATLTRPLDLYTGWFRNEHFGTFIIERVGNGLTVRLGDFTMTPTAGAKPDTLNIRNLIDDTGVLRFVVDEHGYVNRLEMTHETSGTVCFDR